MLEVDENKVMIEKSKLDFNIFFLNVEEFSFEKWNRKKKKRWKLGSYFIVVFKWFSYKLFIFLRNFFISLKMKIVMFWIIVFGSFFMAKYGIRGLYFSVFFYRGIFFWYFICVFKIVFFF